MFPTLTENLSVEEENLELKLMVNVLKHATCQLKLEVAQQKIRIVHLKKEARKWKTEHNYVLAQSIINIDDYKELLRDYQTLCIRMAMFGG